MSTPQVYHCKICGMIHAFQMPCPKPMAQCSLAPARCSVENVRLPNDTKIRFCNALDALRRHGIWCRDCATYIKWGDGDLCAKGKDIVAMNLAYADTKIEFPPNVPAEPSGTRDSKQSGA